MPLDWRYGNTDPESGACIGEGWASSDNCLLFRAYRNMVKLYEEAGSKVVLFQSRSTIGRSEGYLVPLENLWKIKLSLRPDVVHVQYMAPGAIPIILLKLMGQKVSLQQLIPMLMYME